MHLRRPMQACAVVLAVTGSLVVPRAASASTISVDCDHQALQPEIQHAAPGSTLLLSGRATAPSSWGRASP